jgi:hypothetical protein
MIFQSSKFCKITVSSVFSSGQQAPNFEQLRTEPKAAFQYAAFVGSKSVKNLKICAQVFNHCPFSAKIILEVLNIKSAGMAGGETEGPATGNN